MDYETVSAPDFGRSLTGIGLNLLVRDVARTAAALEAVFGMTVHRASADFAILVSGHDVLQLHSDQTYSQNALLNLLPENPPRGAGVELRLYEVDPDEAVARAHAHEGVTVLAEPENKPHGLREAIILDPDGYAWLPSRRLDPSED
ncbi:MAG: VOC family protein [Pseudomonadota bacterium]